MEDQAAQEKLAREWAERIKSVPREYHDEMHHAVADFILAHIKPSTMAGVEWVHADHHMAGAYWEGDIPVVMIDPVDEGKTTVLTVEEESIHEADDSDLTPNGKRYRLVEVSDHPEVLTTVEDYESAPLGTVVASPHFPACTKNRSEEWVCGVSLWKTSEMAGTTHTVLRWGDEA